MTIKAFKPQRTCVVCRKRFDQDELLAITRLKDGSVLLNEGHKKAGRSVYLCKKDECSKKARGSKGKNPLKYWLKVEIPEGIWKELEAYFKNL